jgi:hypothetical protein
MMQSTEQQTDSHIELRSEWTHPLSTGLPSLDRLLPLRSGTLHFIQVRILSQYINIFYIFQFHFSSYF